MLTELENAAKVAGVKQVRRALANGRIKRLYLAKDADPSLTGPLEGQAAEQGVEAVWAGTMKALGRACGIAVGTAAAATLKEGV